MTNAYAEVKVQATVRLPFWKESKAVKINETDTPQIPILYNEKKIKEHTRLACTTQNDLQKYSKALEKKRVRELQDADEDAKKIKAENKKK